MPEKKRIENMVNFYFSTFQLNSTNWQVLCDVHDKKKSSTQWQIGCQFFAKLVVNYLARNITKLPSDLFSKWNFKQIRKTIASLPWLIWWFNERRFGLIQSHISLHKCMVRFSNFLDYNLGSKQNNQCVCITRPKFWQLYQYFLI